jgi:hypothetical protein
VMGITLRRLPARVAEAMGVTVVLSLLCEAFLLRRQLGLVAELVEQALAKCERNTEQVFEAELYRLNARVLLLGASAARGHPGGSLAGQGSGSCARPECPFA